MPHDLIRASTDPFRRPFLSDKQWQLCQYNQSVILRMSHGPRTHMLGQRCAAVCQRCPAVCSETNSAGQVPVSVSLKL